MDRALERFYDAVYSAVEYLQTIRITEIREYLDLMGVKNVHIAIATLIFLMLQFTKVTAILLLSLAIAYGIFYMLDIWYAELKDNKQHNASCGNNSGFGSSYGPRYVPSNGSGTGFNSSPNSHYDYNYSSPYARASRDARTSALFPPFTNGEHSHNPETRLVGMRLVTPMSASRSNLSAVVESSSFRRDESPTFSSNPTSPADIRHQRRPNSDLFDELREARQNILPFQRTRPIGYSVNRTAISSDTHPYYNYPLSVDEHKMRRLPVLFDEYRMKSRSVTRQPILKKFSGTENSVYRSVSRDNLLPRPHTSQVRNSTRFGMNYNRLNNHTSETYRKKRQN